MASASRRDLVLLGGGHAHALALRMLAMRDLGDVRLTLVSLDAETPYSGMLPGLIAGHYDVEDTHIDLGQLCARAGVRFIRARATALDSEGRRLHLEGRAPLGFDLLSIDIGSQPGMQDVPGAEEHAIPVKPVYDFYQRWQDCRERVQAESSVEAPMMVVGGGAGSVELVLAMRFRVGAGAPMTLVCGSQLLPHYHPRTRRRVRLALQEQDIEVLEQQRVTLVEEEEVHTQSGRRLRYSDLFWCTAAEGALWLGQSNLPLDDAGFLRVDDCLQVEGHDWLFAAGDCATQVESPSPKAGVFAVRQAPVLAHNLLARLQQKPLKPFKPQTRFLSMLSLGDRVAVADRGRLSISGSWIWRWKDAIDQGFMRRFSEFKPMDNMLGTHAPDPMQCGGCGSKLPAVLLRSSLSELAKRLPEVMPAESIADDAVAVPLPAGAQLIQTVDVLKGLVDDPALMGRIAVAHTLSDIYAMGATPHSVVAHITVPFGDAELQQRDLDQLLMGAGQELKQAGCLWLGGHTQEGPDWQLGFTANGLQSGQALTKNGLRDGDHLILTQPLGTGVLFVAQQSGFARGRWIQQATDFMLQHNRLAAEIAREFSASACTDVTGFGLAAHLAEMLADSELQARINLDTVPLLEGAGACWAQGFESSLQEANQQAAAHAMAAELKVDAEQATVKALFDPQTSGGLLFGVTAEQAPVVLERLQQAGYTAADIGALNVPDPGSATVVVYSEGTE